MTLDRRSFLRRSSIALAGGLLVGDAALEAFEKLTHSKVFALGGLATGTSVMERTLAFQIYMNKQMEIVARRMIDDMDRFALAYRDEMLIGTLTVAGGHAKEFRVGPTADPWTLHAAQ